MSMLEAFPVDDINKIIMSMLEAFPVDDINKIIMSMDKRVNLILKANFYFSDLCLRVTSMTFSFSFVVNLVTLCPVVP